MLNIVTTGVTRLMARAQDERGQELIEYAALGGLIALAPIAVGVLALSGALTDLFGVIGRCVDFIMGPGL